MVKMTVFGASKRANWFHVKSELQQILTFPHYVFPIRLPKSVSYNFFQNEQIYWYQMWSLWRNNQEKIRQSNWTFQFPENLLGMWQNYRFVQRCAIARLEVHFFKGFECFGQRPVGRRLRTCQENWTFSHQAFYLTCFRMGRGPSSNMEMLMAEIWKYEIGKKYVRLNKLLKCVLGAVIFLFRIQYSQCIYQKVADHKRTDWCE